MSDVSVAGEGTLSWAVMFQAVGMTMEHLDCSGLAAFEALVARSEATGQSVFDLSAAVVERRVRFGARGNHDL